MLVLARKVGQKIIIGKDITIEVVDLGHGQVRLGITAPREVSVHREEVHRRMQDPVASAAWRNPES